MHGMYVWNDLGTPTKLFSMNEFFKERCLEISCNMGFDVSCSCHINGAHRIIVMIMCVLVLLELMGG